MCVCVCVCVYVCVSVCVFDVRYPVCPPCPGTWTAHCPQLPGFGAYGEVEELLRGSSGLAPDRPSAQSVLVPIVARELPPGMPLNSSAAMRDADAVVHACSVLAFSTPSPSPLPSPVGGAVAVVALRNARVSAGDPVTVLTLTGLPSHHVVSQFRSAPASASMNPAGAAGPKAFVEVAMDSFLRARLPGLSDIIGPIVQGVMSPVTDQFMTEAGSELTEKLNADLDNGVGGPVPEDVADCLTLALTYNLTNLVADGTTAMVDAHLTPRLTKRLEPMLSGMVRPFFPVCLFVVGFWYDAGLLCVSG